MSNAVPINAAASSGSSSQAIGISIKPSTEGYNNFTPMSWGSPYHVPDISCSPSTYSRIRTISGSQSDTSQLTGIITKFCREKGHGFIKSNETIGPPLYFHVSDVNDNNVPKEQDHCQFRMIQIPPRNTFQAVDVRLQLKKDDEEQREHW